MNPENRVTAPEGEFENDEAAREYGRQVALDSLLSEALAEQQGSASKIVAFPRWRNVAFAAAALVVAALVVGRLMSPTVALAEGWEVVSSGEDARFEILESHRIRLDSGELRMRSLPGVSSPGELTIETPNATATARGTEFIIGSHPTAQKPNATLENNTMNKLLTRILVLSGTVSLSNAAGHVDGDANTLLTANGDNKPEALAVEAGNDFAFDLYSKLSSEGGNVFFSPLSIYSALAITAEGAGGQTAAEIGKALHFPEGALPAGGDENLPREVAKITASMGALLRLLEAQDAAGSAEGAKIRARVAELKTQFVEMTERMNDLRKNRQWEAMAALFKEERDLVGELNSLASKIDPYELGIANAIWVNQSLPLNPGFVEAVSGPYGTGGAFKTNFSEPEKARERINNWAGEQTFGLIEEVLAPGAIGSATEMVITSAIAFKGDWVSPFNPANTKPAEFFTAAGPAVEVPMMSKKAMTTAKYAAFDPAGKFFPTPLKVDPSKEVVGYPEGGFSMLEMPYKGDAISMLVIAPTDRDGLAELEAQINAGNLTTWSSQLKSRPVNVEMPKFKLSTDYSLIPALKALGIEAAFTDHADFSGMLESGATHPGLKIGLVEHRAVIDVNEEGTAAVAVTGVGLDDRSLAQKPFTPTFRADRPFIVLIRDNESGSLLFMGRVNNPLG